MNAAIEAGADDFNADEDVFEITTDPAEFSAVRETLEAAGYVFESAEQDMIPQNTVDLDEKQASQVERLLEVLEDNDDVQNVYHNANLGE